MSNSKPKKYSVNYSDVYSKEFPCIKASKNGSSFVFCAECRCDISISHGGKGDIVTHLKTVKHEKNVQRSANCSKIDKLFSTQENNSAIRAECYFTSFLIEHNVPFSAADHAGLLFKKMFPESEVAKKYGSGRTKTTNIMKVMSDDRKISLELILQNEPFAIATDGSNGSDKMYPFIVTYFNSENSAIENALLCAPVLIGDSTGKNIGNLILDNLKSRNIPVENCIAFGCDNANVMTGMKNGVASVLTAAHKEIIIIGCLCHLVDLAAGKGLNSLPINIDETLVDIYYYLKKSTKRMEKLKHFQESHEIEVKKILKHVQTRWLSVGRSLNRVIEQWEPLFNFFKEETDTLVKRNAESANLDSYKIPKVKKSSSNQDVGLSSRKPDSMMEKKVTKQVSNDDEKKKKCSTEAPKNKAGVNKSKNIDLDSRKGRIFTFLSSDLTKALCLFIQNITPTLERVCVQFQARKPLIYIMRHMILDFFKELLSKFVKPEIILKSTSPINVNYHSISNQKIDKDIVIGIVTKNVVDLLSKEEKVIFFSCVRKYYMTVLDYIHHAFPHSSEVSVNAEVLNAASIANNQFSKLKYFLEKFPVIVPRDPNETKEAAIDIVQSQFCQLQIEELPTHITEEDRMDMQWSLIGKIKDCLGVKKFDKLSKVMLSLLVIPHSNAECERIFSQVRKIKTDFRSSLSNDSLERLLIVKCGKHTNCYEENFSADFLKKAKSATYVNLNTKTN